MRTPLYQGKVLSMRFEFKWLQSQECKYAGKCDGLAVQNY